MAFIFQKSVDVCARNIHITGAVISSLRQSNSNLSGHFKHRVWDRNDISVSSDSGHKRTCFFSAASGQNYISALRQVFKEIPSLIICGVRKIFLKIITLYSIIISRKKMHMRIGCGLEACLENHSHQAVCGFRSCTGQIVDPSAPQYS